MGIRSFLGFRSASKRDKSHRKGTKQQNNGASRHRGLQIEHMEDRLLLSVLPMLTSVNGTTGSTSGGALVTITGANLAGATAVDFGNSTATIVSDTATQIVANSPAAAAGTVDITVTTPAGTSTKSAADQFTYVTETGPQFVGIVPNTGSVLAEGEILNVAPTQLTLQFNQNEQIDPTTLSAISITYVNAAGTTENAPIGYVTVNDTPNLNQVVVRFDQTLLSGNYTVNIGGGLEGQLNDPTTNKLGPDLPFNGGQAYALNFTLDLGSIVTAVVPQPVTRTTPTFPQSQGSLQQAVNEIDVYFTDPLSAVSRRIRSSIS